MAFTQKSNKSRSQESGVRSQESGVRSQEKYLRGKSLIIGRDAYLCN
jgi:hypothetical protein